MNRYDLSSVRDDFPILSRKIYDKYPLVYLDNAATTQKPRAVVEAMTEEYYNVNANVHRGVHFLSQRATDLHEAARETVRRFLGAASTEEIVFTRGTTESINLVATSMARLHSDDPAREVIVSALEHHSNIVSWQLAGFRLRVIPMSDDGELDLEALEGLFSEHTCLVSVTHVSNVLGVETPVEEIIALGASVLRIEAFAEPMFAAAIVSYSICVGAGDTLRPAIMNLCSMWGIRLTLAALLAPHYELRGVWVAMAVELTFRGGIFLVRIFRERWMKGT